jgi:hypothetical protein
MKTGFTALISAQTGIGSFRAAAVAINAFPPLRDPVKPTAFTSGGFRSSCPIVRPLPKSTEKMPPGIPHFTTAARTAVATIAG